MDSEAVDKALTFLYQNLPMSDEDREELEGVDFFASSAAEARMKAIAEWWRRHERYESARAVPEVFYRA